MRAVPRYWILPAVLLCVPPALAASYVGTVLQGRVGGAVAAVMDVNRDGYDDLLVGAPGNPSPGSAYFFLGSPGGLALNPNLILSAPPNTCPDPDLRDDFGSALAGIGDFNGDSYPDFAIGAQTSDDCNTQVPAGRVYFYKGTANGPVPWWWESTPQGLYGRQVAGAGDINGDGYDDMMILNTAVGGGFPSIHVKYGFSTVVRPTTTLSGGQIGFGTRLASAGDVDGDGFDDIVIFDLQPRVSRLYRGSAAGLVTTPALYLPGRIGRSNGDFNGDGFGDVVVHGQDSVSIHFGATTGLGATPGWSVPIVTFLPPDFPELGSAGDLDGDGDDEVMVGVRAQDGITTMLIYSGDPGGPGTTPTWTLPQPEGTELFGIAAAGVGDFNGDGLGEVAVGAPATDGPAGADAGRVDIFSPVDPTCAADPDADGDGSHAAPCPFNRDCDDTDPARFPDNPEVCDGLDNNCDDITDNVPLPGPVNDMQVDLSQAMPRLVWTPLPGLVYGSARGTLLALNETSGDYSVATDLCLGDGAEIEMSGDPPAGDGFWYLTHARNCTGEGTWDSGSPDQVGSRDPALTVICP